MLIKFIFLTLLVSSTRCCLEERLSVSSANSIESPDNGKSHHNLTQLTGSDNGRSSDSIDTSASEVNEVNSNVNGTISINSATNSTNSIINGTKLLISNGMFCFLL